MHVLRWRHGTVGLMAFALLAACSTPAPTAGAGAAPAPDKAAGPAAPKRQLMAAPGEVDFTQLLDALPARLTAEEASRLLVSIDPAQVVDPPNAIPLGRVRTAKSGGGYALMTTDDDDFPMAAHGGRGSSRGSSRGGRSGDFVTRGDRDRGGRGRGRGGHYYGYGYGYGGYYGGYGYLPWGGYLYPYYGMAGNFYPYAYGGYYPYLYGAGAGLAAAAATGVAAATVANTAAAVNSATVSPYLYYNPTYSNPALNTGLTGSTWPGIGTGAVGAMGSTISSGTPRLSIPQPMSMTQPTSIQQ